MKILVVDDHSILRNGLVRVLKKQYPEYNFIEAFSGNNAISILTENKEIVLVLSDLSMPGMSGIEMMKQMKKLGIKVPVIILTSHSEEYYALRVFKAGAHGFLNKEVDAQELKSAIDVVLNGKKYINSNIADILSQGVSGGALSILEALSDREMEVFQLIVLGRTVSEIADSIVLSVSTVSTYRAKILSKLNLKNDSEIVRFAVQNNLN